MHNLKSFVPKVLGTLLVAGVCIGGFWVGQWYTHIELNQKLTQLEAENQQLKNLRSSSTAAAPSQSIDPNSSLNANGLNVKAKSVVFDDLVGHPAEATIQQLAQLQVFDPVSGKFNPEASINRSEFVRWLFKVNNAIWFD